MSRTSIGTIALLVVGIAFFSVYVDRPTDPVAPLVAIATKEATDTPLASAYDGAEESVIAVLPASEEASEYSPVLSVAEMHTESLVDTSDELMKGGDLQGGMELLREYFIRTGSIVPMEHSFHKFMAEAPTTLEDELLIYEIFRLQMELGQLPPYIVERKRNNLTLSARQGSLSRSMSSADPSMEAMLNEVDNRVINLMAARIQQ